jgi:hypothetical protein
MKHKEKTLPQLVADYAEFELTIDDDCELHKYLLSMDWLDSKKYMILVDITDEALREVSFDITKQEVDKMIDMFIKKLESI